ncbi:metal-sensitive transcriptional regulator [Streptomyces humicola]|nr:metal-sensitive transcriptional regulator [Streptomyces humicola]
MSSAPRELLGRPALAYSAVGREGRRAALRRLRTARGHLDAVVRMLESDRYCVDVLQQLAAVEGAIVRARRAVFEAHVRGCVVDAVRQGALEDGVHELLAVVFGDRPPTGRAEDRPIP